MPGLTPCLSIPPSAMNPTRLLRPLFAACALACTLSSCETTGDPTTGGIFWSESKAQSRLNQKQSTLDSLRSETRRIESDSARKEAGLQGN